jgi:hypothetical protein
VGLGWPEATTGGGSSAFLVVNGAIKMLENKFSLAFWIVLVAIACCAIWLPRSRRWALYSTWGVTGGAAALSIFGMSLALYIGYVAPLSIMQDVVAAREGLQGHPLPTKDLKPYIKAALEEEPVPPSLIRFWPRLGKEGQEEYKAVPDRITEQAHPPFMVLFVAPFVYFLGIHGTFLVISSLSLGFLAAAFILIHCGLDFKLRPDQLLLIICVFLSWSPMFWVIRGGQMGAVLSGLIVMGWYCVRQGRTALGGIAVGIATSLKAFPGLLLVYFLLRHRRAMMSAVATIVVLNLLTMTVWGEKSYEEWIQMAQYVMTRYSQADLNYSLLGALNSLGKGLLLPLLGSETVYHLLSLATVGMLCWIVFVKTNKDFPTTRYDLEYSLFVAAMPLLSPVAWFHYFVVLLLPLAVLAKVAMTQKGNTWSLSLLLGIVLILALPPQVNLRLHAIIQNFSWRLSFLPFLLPPLAVTGIVGWIAILARTPAAGESSSVGRAFGWWDAVRGSGR